MWDKILNILSYSRETYIIQRERRGEFCIKGEYLVLGGFHLSIPLAQKPRIISMAESKLELIKQIF